MIAALGVTVVRYVGQTKSEAASVSGTSIAEQAMAGAQASSNETAIVFSLVTLVCLLATICLGYRLTVSSTHGMKSKAQLQREMDDLSRELGEALRVLVSKNQWLERKMAMSEIHPEIEDAANQAIAKVWASAREPEPWDEHYEKWMRRTGAADSGEC